MSAWQCGRNIEKVTRNIGLKKSRTDGKVFVRNNASQFLPTAFAVPVVELLFLINIAPPSQIATARSLSFIRPTALSKRVSRGHIQLFNRLHCGADRASCERRQSPALWHAVKNVRVNSEGAAHQPEPASSTCSRKPCRFRTSAKQLRN